MTHSPYHTGIVLDVESSGLSPESYPIQIAWKAIHTDECDSFYIKPKEEWTHWDFNAEAIHNIPRYQLSNVGISIEEAQERLRKAVSKYECIYTDAPSYDERWVMRLYEDTMYDIPMFKHIADLIPSDYLHLLFAIMRGQERNHDALNDCKDIITAYKTVMDDYVIPNVPMD